MKEIEKYLPSGWKEMAVKLGALQRKRGIQDASSLLRLNMLYTTNNGSYQLAAAGMKLTEGVTLSKVAAYKRIKNSGEWLRQMAVELCKSHGFRIETPAFLADRQVKLYDASDEVTRGANKTTWRLHYVFDLFAFECAGMELTTNAEGERLTRHKISKDEIVVADRIYCTMSGIEYVLKAEADYLLRYKSKAFNLYDKTGKRLEILPYLRELGELESKDIICYYKTAAGELKSLRLVAMRKDAKAIAASVKRMQRKVSKKQEKAAEADTQELNEYVVLATSLTYTKEQVLELYRARWQIEQVFFRLKQLFGYGDTPNKSETSIRAWFYGKLLLATLCESILKGVNFPPKPEIPVVDIIGAQFME